MVKGQLFTDSANTIAKIVELFKNLNYPIEETKNDILKLNQLIFNKDVVTMTDIKNAQNEYVSTNPYLRFPEYDHTKIIIYYDSFIVDENDGFFSPPLSIDILVPESLWLVKNTPRVLLILQSIYNILNLAEVGAVGKLQCTKVTPLVVQDMVGYSMMFETSQYE
jgi:hypothetical protein